MKSILIILLDNLKTNSFCKALAIILIGFMNWNTQAQVASDNTKAPVEQRRFFSETSFWNQPIPENPEIDAQKNHYIRLLKREYSGAFFKNNLDSWTIPV